MRSKAPLTLMEQLLMVLVFALAAVLCLQAFSAADRGSRQNALRDRAVTEAQNAAEVLKGCRGDYETAADLYGGTWDGERWIIRYDSYTLQAIPQASESGLLGRAEIQVTAPDGSALFTLPAAWQKEGDAYG